MSTMFRRRTDQVYATLQQVQRRITEAAPGSPAPTADRSGTVPPFGPLQEALQRQKAPPPVVGHQPEPPPPPPQLAPMPTGRILLPLTVPFALTLTVLWIVSCVLCFVLGQHERERRMPNASVGFASGDAGNRDAPPQPQAPTDPGAAKPLGPDLLVLTQVPTATAEMEQFYRQRVAQLNDIMTKNTSRGWKPWFGIRKPSNGSLQLVFGEVSDGQFGVNRKDFEDFARMLAQPPPKGGGYGSAIWVKTN
jgi:hypothetical protein